MVLIPLWIFVVTWDPRNPLADGMDFDLPKAWCCGAHILDMWGMASRARGLR